MVSIYDPKLAPPALSVADAKKQIDRRLRMRFDGHAMSWTVQDAQAARLLLTHIASLEQRLSLRRPPGPSPSHEGGR